MSEQTKIIQPQAGFQERFVRSNVDVVIGGGVLNSQPIDCLIATPNGFVRMGDINAGDIICNPKGGLQKVNYVIDKGYKECVEFILDDGRIIESDLEHHWRVKDSKKGMMEVSAQYIINRIEDNRKIDNRHKKTLRIPTTAPVEYKDMYYNERPIHPYVLGCLLGDGWFSDGHYYIGFCNPDKEIVDRIISLGYNLKKSRNDDEYSYELRDNKVKEYLKQLGLWNRKSHNKFIPNSYKYAPLEERMELIRGLMDTDGTSSIREKRFRVGYRTVSPFLRDDLREMLWAIGAKVSICTTPPAIRKRRKDSEQLMNCKESYGFYIVAPNNRDLFHLSRKKEKCQSDKERKVKLALTIKDYRLTGKKLCRCINVNGEEHEYLTNNYVITKNCGKTFAAILSVAEPVQDSRFRAVFLRNNLGDLKSGGGILDEFKNVYGKSVNVVESGDPHVDFQTGARIDVTHVSDQSRDKVLQRFKGRQYDLEYFDEMTGFTWECFTTIFTRNRGTAKWTGKVRGTTNPDRNHWLRTFLDWYIGIDGFIREDREGVVRYFYIAGETVKDVVWGDTKEEVYHQCKSQIDRTLKKINGKTGKATYKDMIKSFTFYLGRMSENKASIGNNSGYVGSVAVAGGRNAEQLLEGNWNVSPSDSLDAPIPSDMANQVFVNDPCVNGDRWVTCDLADTGTDNFLCLAWDGFHVIDSLILGKTTPRQNAEQLQMFAEHHDVSDSHIIYDAIRGTYINDYIPDAIPFFSYAHPMGVYGRMARQLKDECYMRLIEMIKRGDLSISEKVGTRIYEHQKLKENITIQNEFIEECAVVRFKEVQNGKKTLLSKREMNQKLGKGRSMDLLDPCAMRMLPVLHLPYGDERIGSAIDEDDEDEETDAWGQPNSIYEDSTWC